MEALSSTNKRLKEARANIERDYEAQVKKLDESERKLMQRMDTLNSKKHEIAKANGNIDIADDDIVEINAGGKIIAAKRGTLTQLKGTRLESLFSGRWDKKLQRDNDGRIFLDVDPACFQAIVDYLNELAISSEDNPPHPPSVDDEHKHILTHQLSLFGISDQMHDAVESLDSTIIKDESKASLLYGWLKEDGSDGDLSLLYRSSRDGHGNLSFHSKCDDKGCTLTVIETTCGRIFGGYSNTPWKGGGGKWVSANKAFLFSLGDSPCKMKLKNANDSRAVCNYSSYGPTFGSRHDLRAFDGLVFGGQDLCVRGDTITTHFGCSYESGTSAALQPGTQYTIKEVEVFQVVTDGSSTESITKPKKKKVSKASKLKPVTQFSVGINEAINAKEECLFRARLEMSHLENSFEDEQTFIDGFACGDDKEVATLNVSGAIMMTQRSTLCVAEDSVLAQQFDDSKWTEQGFNTPRVNEWTPDDVYAWARDIDDVSDEVAIVFVENDITGNELLALTMEGLNLIGIGRAGTQCLLLKEIGKLEKASQDVSTFIEHGPYCFGKNLDHLRLKQIHSLGLAEEPELPKVCESQKERFEKVVKYYFPGDSSKFILG